MEQSLCYAYRILGEKEKSGFIEAYNDLDAYHQLSNEFNAKQNDILLVLNGTWDQFQNEIQKDS